MEKNMLTIIIPVYKTEQFLRRCMDSLCNQSYRNLEIIAVNDGSPDNCLRILKEYAQNDSRIIVMDKENGGANTARNLALTVAKGEWVSFVDSDDWLDLNYYQELMQYADLDCQLICGGFILNESGQSYKVSKNVLKSNRIDSIETLFSTYYGMLYNVWGKVFKKDIIRNNNLLFRSFLRDDGIFLLDYYQHVNSVNIISTTSFLHYNTENINSNTHKIYGIERIMLDLFKYHNSFIKNAETDFSNFDRYMHIINMDKTKSFCDILHECYPLSIKEKLYWYRRMINQTPQFTLSKYVVNPTHRHLRFAFLIRSSYLVLITIFLHSLYRRICYRIKH